MLQAVFSTFEEARFDFGRTINFRIYQEDRVTPFNATGLTGTLKSYRRHGDGNDFVFIDSARAIGLLRGNIAQIIDDIPVNFTSISTGVGNFAYTATERPSIQGYLWLEIVLQNASSHLSTKQERIFIWASEGA